MPHDFITLGRDAKNIAGQRFGRLIVLGPIARQPDRNIRWRCLCDCGNIKDVASKHLLNDATYSCGCFSKEDSARRNTTHGMKSDPVYHTWSNIIQRCTNPNNGGFPNYGGRGIIVCDEWQHDFRLFHGYVSGLPHYKKKGYSLDRIDNNGNYEPGNMRWATRTEQGRNRRMSIFATHNGKTQHLKAWALEFGISYPALYGRLYRGWSVERALSEPARRRAP